MEVKRCAYVLCMEKAADVNALSCVQARELPIRARGVRGAVFEAPDELFLLHHFKVLVLVFLIVTAHIHLILFFSILGRAIDVVLATHLQLCKHCRVFLLIDLHLIVSFFASTEFLPALGACKGCAFASFDEDFDGFLGSHVNVTEAKNSAHECRFGLLHVWPGNFLESKGTCSNQSVIKG
jgi:hypothetical protein